MESVTHLGCWAHLRRKFDEADKALPKGSKTVAAVTGRRTVRNCSFERELQGLAQEKRYEERLKREKPLLDEFRAWADARTAASKSKLGQAFVYLANRRTPLTNYIPDGRLEISNNRAEANALNPYRYLLLLLEEFPNADRRRADWMELFLPCNAPDDCRMTRE